MNASEKDIEFGATKLLTSLPTQDSRVVTIPHIGSIEDFSRFCIEDLYKYVETEYVLLVQYDGFVLSADRWDDAFLAYDYIGAPLDTSTWKDWPYDWAPPSFIVGNGGFCIRSKRFMELSSTLVKEGEITKMHPEDVALCVWYKDLFEKEGLTFAPVDLAMRFSVNSDYGEYEKPFGFYGLYGKNLDLLNEEHPDFPAQYLLPRIRKARLQKIKKIFEEIAIEGHFFGSMARGTADEFSDVDVWLTFRNEDMTQALENRFEYYAQIGDIVHIVEPPQNSPVGGIQSTVLYKTKVGLFIVDYSLCPLATAFITKEGKKLFGLDLPLGEAGFNPQKIVVLESYRIDFFISFIFNGIKKLVRKDDAGFDHVLREYEYLSSRYGLEVKELTRADHSFDTLKEIIKNIYELSTDRQKKALIEISAFIKIVE